MQLFLKEWKLFHYFIHHALAQCFHEMAPSWNIPLCCLPFTRSCQLSEYLASLWWPQSPKPFGENRDFHFFPCQIGQVFPARYPPADTQTVDRETAWFRWATPRKMREHVWQFQGYWAARRLKAENYVRGTASLRSERCRDKYVRSLGAYFDIYLRGETWYVCEKEETKIKMSCLEGKVWIFSN